MDDEEILEQESDQVGDESTTTTNEHEPMIIETRGKWQDFEKISKQNFEIGKTYKVEVGGVCKLNISPTKPTKITDGMSTDKITFTKDEVNKLWILTGKGE